MASCGSGDFDRRRACPADVDAVPPHRLSRRRQRHGRSRRRGSAPIAHRDLRRRMNDGLQPADAVAGDQLLERAALVELGRRSRRPDVADVSTRRYRTGVAGRW